MIVVVRGRDGHGHGNPAPSFSNSADETTETQSSDNNKDLESFIAREPTFILPLGNAGDVMIVVGGSVLILGLTSLTGRNPNSLTTAQ